MNRHTDDDAPVLVPSNLDQALKVIAQRAPALRAAGIRKATVNPDGGIQIELDPPEPEPLPPEEIARRDRAARNPLHDPAMYNRSDGVPGLRRLEEYEDE